MKHPLLIAACLVLVPPAFPSSTLAATLKPMTTLDSPVVKLSDLFDEAGAGAARVLGPGPAPGARIVVEAPQLAAIARQFGVDWRPASPTDRAVLDRPGRVLPREEVLGTLRAALAGLGAGEDLEFDLPGYVPPTVPQTGQVDTAVEQLDWDAGSGRFTGMLVVSGPGMAIERQRLSGTAMEMAMLPVPVRRMNPGAVLQPDDLRLARLRTGLARGEVARDLAQAVGMTLRRVVVPGQPLAMADLMVTPLIARGTRVRMELISGGLSVATEGIAMDSGVAGERIRLLNPGSRAVVEAEITGPNRVRVTPDSLPGTLPANRVAQLTAQSGYMQPAGGRTQ